MRICYTRKTLGGTEGESAEKGTHPAAGTLRGKTPIAIGVILAQTWEGKRKVFGFALLKNEVIN